MSNNKITTTSVRTTIIEVKNLTIASALRGIDVPFYSEERPSTMLAFADGRRVTVWRFKPKSIDGIHDTYKLATESAGDIYAWISKNPEHPFAYALSAALRAEQFTLQQQTRRALVGYQIKGERTMYVFENSRRHEKLKEAGAKQL